MLLAPTGWPVGRFQPCTPCHILLHSGDHVPRLDGVTALHFRSDAVCDTRECDCGRPMLVAVVILPCLVLWSFRNPRLSRASRRQRDWHTTARL